MRSQAVSHRSCRIGVMFDGNYTEPDVVHISHAFASCTVAGCGLCRGPSDAEVYGNLGEPLTSDEMRQAMDDMRRLSARTVTS